MVQKKLAVTVDTALALGFFIEEAPERESGFKPAEYDRGGKQFREICLAGLAALLRLSFAKRLIVVGGVEISIPDVNRAWAIREMLVQDFWADPKRVEIVECPPNTLGNIQAISKLTESNFALGECGIVTSFYHIPRVSLDLVAADLPIPIYPAEAFLLVENEDRKSEIIRELGDGPLAERVGEELQGIADKLCGSYKPRTK